MGRVTGVGVTVMVANGPVVTTTVAVPETCPLVAWTVFAKVPGPVAAVNSPVLVMAPPPATTAHVGASSTTLPPASLPTAVNCWVPVMDKATGVGVTVMVANGPVVTTTVAVPETCPLVAWTVFAKVPGPVPAVNNPVLVMAPPPATTAHVGASSTTLPPASLPTAVNRWVPVMDKATGVGVTVMVANGPVVTTTVAVPETCPLVAWTVFAKVPGPVPAVNNPVLLMTPPPATTDQTGEIATAAPSASLPTAMNRWVSVMASETLGVTVMLASVRGPAGE